MEQELNQLIEGCGAGEDPRTPWCLRSESGSGGWIGPITICENLANRVHSAIPKTADDALAERVFEVLCESVFETLFTALESATRVVKNARQARQKHSPPNAPKGMSVTAIAGHLVERTRQDLPHIIDDAIELSVHDTWAEYAEVPLWNIVRRALAENNPSHRTGGFERLLEEYALDELSLKFVPQEVRDALGSAINEAMLEIAHAELVDNPGVSPDAIAGILRRNFRTSLIPVINAFAKGALQSVADVACAVVAEVMEEALYGGDWDTEPVSTGAEDGDGDVVMGGC